MPDIPAIALWWQRREPSKLQFYLLIIGIINIHIKANKYGKLHQDLKM